MYNRIFNIKTVRTISLHKVLIIFLEYTQTACRSVQQCRWRIYQKSKYQSLLITYSVLLTSWLYKDRALWPTILIALDCLFRFVFVHKSKNYNDSAKCPLFRTTTKIVVLIWLRQTHSQISSESMQNFVRNFQQLRQAVMLNWTVFKWMRPIVTDRVAWSVRLSQ